MQWKDLVNTDNTQPNDVWSTIGKGLDAVKEFQIRRGGATPQTQATPSGDWNWDIWNPFPGTQNAYPQAQAKATFAPAVGGSMGLIVVAFVVVLALVLLRR